MCNYNDGCQDFRPVHDENAATWPGFLPGLSPGWRIENASALVPRWPARQYGWPTNVKCETIVYDFSTRTWKNPLHIACPTTRGSGVIDLYGTVVVDYIYEKTSTRVGICNVIAPFWSVVDSHEPMKCPTFLYDSNEVVPFSCLLLVLGFAVLTHIFLWFKCCRRVRPLCECCGVQC